MRRRTKSEWTILAELERNKVPLAIIMSILLMNRGGPMVQEGRWDRIRLMVVAVGALAVIQTYTLHGPDADGGTYYPYHFEENIRTATQLFARGTKRPRY